MNSTDSSPAAHLALGLVAVQAVLAAAFWWTRDQGFEQLGVLRAVFWMGGEFRLPALFAVAQAWLAAALAWRCHRHHPHAAWATAAVVCAYIGADELLSVHETLGALLLASGWVTVDPTNTVQVAGVRSFTWILIYMPVAGVVGLALLKGFWSAVGPRHLAWLVLAAVTFLGGAVGMELVQAEGQADRADWLLTTAGHAQLLAEETLETLGMTLAVWVFAQHAGLTGALARGAPVDARVAVAGHFQVSGPQGEVPRV
jgi:hypothetical protein